MFGADTSTSNRATLGGMIGNNSAGSHSVRFGMTIDHVRALDVVLSDASRARFAPGAEPEPGSLSEAIHRGLPEIVERYREAIERDHPRFWRHAGGYRLDRLMNGFDLARFVVGSEGTLLLVTEAEVDLIERPAAQAIAVGHFRSIARGDRRRPPTRSARDAAAVEMMDDTILRLSRERLEYAGLYEILEGEPAARCCSSRSSPTARPRRAPRSRRWPATGSATATATTRCARRDRRPSGAAERSARPASGC